MLFIFQLVDQELAQQNANQPIVLVYVIHFHLDYDRSRWRHMKYNTVYTIQYVLTKVKLLNVRNIILPHNK